MRLLYLRRDYRGQGGGAGGTRGQLYRTTGSGGGSLWHDQPALPGPGRLKEILARADALIIQQRDGISEVRAATVEKREIRRRIRRTHLPHLSRVAEAAGIERPELAKKLELPSEALPYLAFRSAVQGILTEAQNKKELLARFGMVDPAPSSLSEALGLFDRAVARGVAGRRAHVGARAELEAIADEVLQQVRQLDGLIRFRFANNPEGLATWRSASNIVGPPRGSGGTPSEAKVSEAGKDADHAA